MPPQQPGTVPGPSMPSPAHEPSQYDFIMGYGATPKAPKLTSSSTPQRVLIVLGGVLILFFIGWILFSVLTKPGSTSPSTLLPVVQQENELARISVAPTQQAVQNSTKSFAETVQLVMMTQQTKFLNYLAKYNYKPNAHLLAGTQSAATDSQLSQAQTTGTYDATYVSIAQAELKAYQQTLSRIYATAKSVTEKQLLKNAYTQTQQLLTMSTQIE